MSPSPSSRRTNLSKSSYAETDAYARDILAGGGPSLRDLASVNGVGENVQLVHAIYGTSEKQFEEACQYEFEEEVRARRHIFVRKWRG